MDNSEQNELEQEAKELIVWGFEQGFRQAIDCINGIATDGKHQETRDMAKIFVKLLEKALPEYMAAAPDMFKLQILDDGSINPNVTAH